MSHTIKLIIICLIAICSLGSCSNMYQAAAIGNSINTIINLPFIVLGGIFISIASNDVTIEGQANVHYVYKLPEGSRIVAAKKRIRLPKGGTCKINQSGISYDDKRRILNVPILYTKPVTTNPSKELATITITANIPEKSVLNILSSEMEMKKCKAS